jgi:hypothetical protein
MSCEDANHPLNPSLDSEGVLQAPKDPVGLVSPTASQKTDDYKSTKEAGCVYCSKTYVCSNGSTSNMWKHVSGTTRSMII